MLSTLFPIIIFLTVVKHHLGLKVKSHVYFFQIALNISLTFNQTSKNFFLNKFRRSDKVVLLT